MKSIKNKILSRIYGRGRGNVFTPKDFSGEFSRIDTDKALSDLYSEGLIRRVLRGVYDYPAYSDTLKQKLSPDISQIAQALARKFRWRIQPSGETALNLLGLSTQVPGRVMYLSDGPTRKYKVGNTTLEFKKHSLKNSDLKNKESVLTVQALKALGKGHLNEEVAEKLRFNFSDEKRQIILKDARYVTGWIYEFIRKTFKEAGR